MNEEDASKVFVKLGLSYLQAKIYFALLKVGCKATNVKNISKLSNVPRQEVYRIIPSLQRRGLVEKLLGNPTLYRGIPLKEALSKLLEENTNEFEATKEKATILLNSFKVAEPVTTEHSESLSCFLILIDSLRDLEEKYVQASTRWTFFTK